MKININKEHITLMQMFPQTILTNTSICYDSCAYGYLDLEQRKLLCTKNLRFVYILPCPTEITNPNNTLVMSPNNCHRYINLNHIVEIAALFKIIPEVSFNLTSFKWIYIY